MVRIDVEMIHMDFPLRDLSRQIPIRDIASGGIPLLYLHVKGRVRFQADACTCDRGHGGATQGFGHGCPGDRPLEILMRNKGAHPCRQARWKKPVTIHSFLSFIRFSPPLLRRSDGSAHFLLITSPTLRFQTLFS
jgi:hypothetical protein